jgi:hypothetical protein
LKNRIIFPRAFAVAIDDMGWINGSHLGRDGGMGPSRAGVDRHFDISDYKAVAEAGKATGVRLQGLFVLCEMDRQNVCSGYPTTTMMGRDWDNAANVSDEQLETIDFVKQNAAFIEFGMHGVGHEFWPEKMHRVRAEWYNLIEKKPWPEEILRGHFKCFGEIMKQYGLSEESGHSFPESFAPCAYSYYWNPDGDYSLGKLLKENGVKYANTDFSYIVELNPPRDKNGGGFDHGVHILNRINYGNRYFEYESLPLVPPECLESDVIESHFVNWLSAERSGQAGTTGKWINYLNRVQCLENRYLAKNTGQLHSQWLYNKFTMTEEPEPGVVTIDNTQMPDDVYNSDLLGNMLLKLRLGKGEHVSFASLDDDRIASYFEENGFAFLYLPPLMKKKYVLKYTTGYLMMDEFVFNSGTYNIYKVESNGSSMQFDIKMFGTQTVLIKCRKPRSVSSSNPHLEIISDSYNDETGYFSIEISGRNITGESGTVTLRF